MLKIYLARHGQDEDLSNRILNGRRDTPLTELGIAQAHEAAEKILNAGLAFDAVYASPLQRAFKTAEIISQVSHNPAPIVEPLLIERDFGIMTGVSHDKILELCMPDVLQTEKINYFLSPTDAETFPDLLHRAQSCLEKVQKQHQDGSVLLVGHGDFGKMLYAAYYQLPWQEVLKSFNFGNSELLLLSPDSPPEDTHIFQIKQEYM